VDALEFVIGLLVNGLIVGSLGRLLLPGKDPIGLPATVLVGIVASAVAGTVTYLIFDGGEWIGLALSLLFAVAIVALVRSMRGGRDERVTMEPAAMERSEP
jgi:uncharacterized membrane protein YeaQ/YmgE (transglycosylase-associated protein family)